MRFMREVAGETLRGFDGLYAALISAFLVMGAAIVLWDLMERLG